MSITFFKQQELIDSNNLMSVPNGDSRLQACTEAYYGYFNGLVKNINHDIKTVITGWRRGYSATAVADYLIMHRINKLLDADQPGQSAHELFREMSVLMGYNREVPTWGDDYKYAPALEELDRDPLEIQQEINERAQAAADGSYGEPIKFGVYQNNAGMVRCDKDVTEVAAFRRKVVDAISARQRQFFTVNEVDPGNV